MTDLTNIDFGDHAPKASSDKLVLLTDLVKEMEIAEADVRAAEADLRAKSARLRGIVEHELPDLMLELNQPVLHTSDGRKIEIKDVVRASLPEANRPKGYEWLIKNGHAGIVKRTVEVAFAAVQGKEADALLTEMVDEHGANARQVMKVEPSTLTAWVKKRLKSEEELPRDIFEIREFKHAKISKR